MPDSGIQLLSSTVYGTKGLRLKHLDARRKLKELIDPDFHVLFDDEKIIAVITFCKRERPLEGIPLGYYIRYFSVDKTYQHLGVGKYLVSKAVSYYKETLTEPALVYAYIEGENLKSISVSNHFDPVINSSFKVLFFNRFKPKKNDLCYRANETDLAEVNEKLEKHNQMYISYNLARIGYQDNYFVLRRKDKIVAGLQAIETNWEVVNNPGFSGFMIQSVFSKIPFINRLAQGKKMQFVAVEGVFYDSANDFQLLLEHVLAELKQYVAFIYFDIKDHRLKEVENIELGLMSKIQKSPQVNILHFGWKLNDDLEEKLKKGVNYVSAYDIT